MDQRRVAGAEWWPVPVDFLSNHHGGLEDTVPSSQLSVAQCYLCPLGILHTLAGLLGLTGNSALAGAAGDTSAIF